MSDLFPIQNCENKTPATDRGVHRLVARIIGAVPGLSGTPLTNRLKIAVNGSIWTFVGYGASQLLKLASTLILARLLSPKAFGLMALVNVFLVGLEVLSDLGIGLDIVQHPRGEDAEFLDTAFIIQIARSLLLCLAAAGIAIPFAAFYHQPEVRWLAAVGAFSIAIRGFSSMSIWTMTRHVEMGKLTAVNVIGDSGGLLVSILWGLISPTAWALVGGKLAAAAAYVIASHVFSNGAPSLRFERRAAKEILLFGTGIFLSSATYFLSTESERLVVGKFASVTELGCFSLAISISYAPFGVVQRIISNVFFPMISDTAREDRDKAALHFKKFRSVFLIASVALAVGFLTLSKSIVHLVLGPQYAQTGWMLQLLGFRAGLELFGSAAGAMLLAVGVARYAAFGNVAKLCFLGVGLTVAFARFGLHEAILVLAISPLVHYAVLLWGFRKHVHFALRAEFVCFGAFSGVAILVLLLRHALL